jgi:hypothetical protein
MYQILNYVAIIMNTIDGFRDLNYDLVALETPLFCVFEDPSESFTIVILQMFIEYVPDLFKLLLELTSAVFRVLRRFIN